MPRRGERHERGAAAGGREGVIGFALGLLLFALGLAVLSGAPGWIAGPGVIDLFPFLGFTGTGLLMMLGLSICAAALVERALAREGAPRHALRSGRLTAAAIGVAGVLALGAPLAAELLNLVRLDGTPLGFYLAAQGGLVLLVLLAFAWAGRQNRIDAEEGP